MIVIDDEPEVLRAAGARTAVAPGGSPLTLNAKAPEKPERGRIDAEKRAAVPCGSDWPAGEAFSRKFGPIIADVGATRAIVTVAAEEPPAAKSGLGTTATVTVAA